MDRSKKKCGRCGQTKEVSEFRLVESQCQGIAGYCFSCESEYNKERYLKDKNKQIEGAKEYYQQNKEKCRARNRENKKKIEHKLRNNIIKKAKKAGLKPPYNSIVGCSSKEFYKHVFSLTTYPMTEDNYGDVWYLGRIRPIDEFNDPRDAFHYTNFVPTINHAIPSKICKKCNIKQPETEFTKNAHNDTLKKTCKNCMYNNRSKRSHEQTKKKWREYHKMKMETDPSYRIIRRLRKRVGNLISGSPTSISRAVGCSKEELKRHLESQWKDGMNWDNYGTYWVIDHIKPVASFNLEDPEEIKKCCHYTNLQPLTAEENSKKAAIYEGINYANSQNKPLSI